MSGDIVERLRRWDDGRVSIKRTHYDGCIDSHPVCAILWAADAIEARDAEIERLREQVRWASDRASEWKLETYQLNTEIELLRAALAIAAGMISTLPPYEDQHPEAVMEMLLEEARREQ